MIKFENLTKIYKLNDNNRLRALNNISFEIKDNEIYGIMGVSGSGKSTILRILRGVESFDEGKIIIDDLEITPENYNQHTNFLKQKTAIHLQRSFGLWSETAVENIIRKLFGLEYSDESLADLSEIREEYIDEALDILDTVGLKDKADHFAPVLSGGEKQRLVLARQLVKKPEILLLDEPATMSSPKVKKEILETIKKINKKYGTTVVLVSHQPEIQEYLSDKILLLFNGEIKTIDEPSIVIKDFLSEAEPIQKIADLPRTENIIKVEDLNRDFYLYKGGHVLTIENVSFNVNKGEILSIIGPTGSGKTEILRMIAGFEQPDSGTIKILTNGEWTQMDDYGKNRMNIRKNMGFMHQEFTLTPYTSIIEQLGSKLSPKLDDVYETATKKAEELNISSEALDIIYQLTDLSRNESINKLQKINLSPQILEALFPQPTEQTVLNYSQSVFDALDLPIPLLNRQFIELSGGQKVRVAIASVLTSNPDILILDEPFGDLDPITLRTVANSLKTINEKLGITIIIVSHTMDFVKEVSTRTILLNKGKLIDEGEPELITDRFLKMENISE